MNSSNGNSNGNGNGYSNNNWNNANNNNNKSYSNKSYSNNSYSNNNNKPKSNHGGGPKICGHPMAYWQECYVCAVCRIDISGEESLVQHCQGKNHAKVRALP